MRWDGEDQCRDGVEKETHVGAWGGEGGKMLSRVTLYK